MAHNDLGFPDVDEPFGCNALIALECNETYCCWSTTVMYSFVIIFVAIIIVATVFAFVYNFYLADILAKKVPPSQGPTEGSAESSKNPDFMDKSIKSCLPFDKYPLLSLQTRKNLLKLADNKIVQESNEDVGVWETFDWSLVQSVAKKND